MQNLLSATNLTPGLTKVECEIAWNLLGGASSAVLFNPYGRVLPAREAAGSFVFLVLRSEGESPLLAETGKKLTIEGFRAAVLNEILKFPEVDCVQLVKKALLETHKRVRAFSENMNVSGAITSRALALVVRNEKAVCARAFDGQVNLLRQGNNFPFFVEKTNIEQRRIGAEEQLSAEVVSVDLHGGDVLRVQGEPFGALPSDDLFTVRLGGGEVFLCPDARRKCV